MFRWISPNVRTVAFGTTGAALAGLPGGWEWGIIGWIFGLLIAFIPSKDE